MRILHVIPSVSELSGGPATAIFPMCRALQEEGFDVVVLTTKAGLRDHEIPVGRIANYRGVPSIFFQSGMGESFKYSRPLALWLNANIRQFSLAHIHAVFNHSSIATAQACTNAGIPYVIRPLGTLDPWSMKQKPLRKRIFWHLFGKRVVQSAAAVHYTTQAEKLATEGWSGLNHGKVIALGVEPKRSGSGSRSKLAQHFPALAEDPYVLVLSRLHPKKGLEVLLDAFLAVSQAPKFARWRLVIAGDGPADYILKLKSIVGLSSQGERVLFTGWLDGERKTEVLSGASLLALPSRQENFGLCVIEALSHSVPVLLSPQVNLADEIVLANAGWIATVDKDVLAARLTEALSDEQVLRTRGCAGEELSRRYSWQNAAKQMADLYREVIRNGGTNLH
jgi:glycosyltransferase involved in cell wall biosynthesis